MNLSEEIIRQLMLDNLINEYGYPLDLCGKTATFSL
jgi:hypothetical protein